MLVFQNLFKGHHYERPLAGDPAVVKAATTTQLESFYKRFFTPERCSLAVLGDIQASQVKDAIIDIFGTLPQGEKEKKNPIPTAPPLKKSEKITRTLDIKRAHLMVAFQAPPIDHQDQLALNVLKHILGRGINPMLGQAMILRGRRLTYRISTLYIALQYGGAFIIHFTVEPKDMKMAQQQLFKFLKQTWKMDFSLQDIPSSQRSNSMMDYLETARNNIKFTYQQFQELGLNAAQSFANYMIYYPSAPERSPGTEKTPEKVATTGTISQANHDSKTPTGSKTLESSSTDEKKKEEKTYMQRLEEITSGDIRAAASQYLSGKKYIMISILPNKTGDKEQTDHDDNDE